MTLNTIYHPMAPKFIFPVHMYPPNSGVGHLTAVVTFHLDIQKLSQVRHAQS